MTLFTRLAGERRNSDYVASAQIAAIGAQVGFTGKTDAIRALRSSLRTASTSSTTGDLRSRLRSLVDELNQHGERRDVREPAGGGEG